MRRCTCVGGDIETVISSIAHLLLAALFGFVAVVLGLNVRWNEGAFLSFHILGVIAFYCASAHLSDRVVIG